MTCYACESAEAGKVFIKFRGPADCQSCDARALALVYGGMQREQIDPVLHLAWKDTKAFREGRRMFWNWVAAIEKARERAEIDPREFVTDTFTNASARVSMRITHKPTGTTVGGDGEARHKLRESLLIELSQAIEEAKEHK